MARRAHSLTTLLDQVNRMAPKRSRISDGWIGDAAHQAVASDHNPNAKGIVLAQDITHDPAHGADMKKIADAIIASKDSRIWYIIFNRKIWERSVGWKNYYGTNPHTKHAHFNTVRTQPQYDDPRKWTIKKGGAAMITEQGLEIVTRYYLGRDPKASEKSKYVGKVTFDSVANATKASDEYKKIVAALKGADRGVKVAVLDHLPGKLRG